jgi:hypothetical protein
MDNKARAAVLAAARSLARKYAAHHRNALEACLVCLLEGKVTEPANALENDGTPDAHLIIGSLAATGGAADEVEDDQDYQRYILNRNCPPARRCGATFSPTGKGHRSCSCHVADLYLAQVCFLPSFHTMLHSMLYLKSGKGQSLLRPTGKTGGVGVGFSNLSASSPPCRHGTGRNKPTQKRRQMRLRKTVIQCSTFLAYFWAERCVVWTTSACVLWLIVPFRSVDRPDMSQTLTTARLNTRIA